MVPNGLVLPHAQGRAAESAADILAIMPIAARAWHMPATAQQVQLPALAAFCPPTTLLTAPGAKRRVIFLSGCAPTASI